MAATAQARPGPRPKKPDLVVTPGNLSGTPYGFVGAIDNEWTGKTKNKGRKQAGRSTTRVYLQHTGRRVNFVRVGVPKLEVGEDFKDTARAVAPNGIKTGEYALQVCADATDEVRESNESNNCRLVGSPKQFFISFRSWTGSLRGKGELPGGGTAVEDWSSANVAWTFAGYQDPGLFVYNPTGTVTSIDSGVTTGNCTVIGNGSSPISSGALILDYPSASYTASANVNPGSYKYEQFCGGAPDSYPGPQFSLALATFLQFGSVQPLPFGATTLSGAFTDETNTNNTWDFAGNPG